MIQMIPTDTVSETLCLEEEEEDETKALDNVHNTGHICD
jgi:hypothetical protein